MPLTIESLRSLCPTRSGADYVLLPQNLLTSGGVLLEDFETTTGWTVNNGSLANDATHFKTGTQSVEFTSVVGGLARATKGVSWARPNNQEVRLWAYVADASKVVAGTMQLMLASHVDLTPRFHIYPTIQQGWNLFSFKNADWTLLGGMTWAQTIIYVRLQFNGATGEQGVVSYDTLVSDVIAQPAIMLTFDDAHLSVYSQAYSCMRTRNIPGTFYVWTANVGQANNVTTAHLLEMQAAGWTIASHTQTHADLTALTQGQVEAELSGAKGDLEGWGIAGNGPLHVAYPGGMYNDTVLAAMAAQNMLTGRHISLPAYPVLPFAEPYRIPVGKQFGNTVSLANALAWVDGVIARRELGIALFHTLVESPSSSTQWGIADFQAFCQYLATNRVPCITIDQAYQLQNGAVRCCRAR